MSNSLTKILSRFNLSYSVNLYSKLPIINGKHIPPFSTPEKSQAIFLPYQNKNHAYIPNTETNDLHHIISESLIARKKWKNTPMPERGEIVRQIGNELREKQMDLASLITYEVGKPIKESVAEVKEAIDICDYAVGLSRQSIGSVYPSERNGHFMMETFKPYNNLVGIVTAFNFPIAVYFWNLAISMVMGNNNILKPSPNALLPSIASFSLVQNVIRKNKINSNINSIVFGDKHIVETMSKCTDFDLISFTGSTEAGKNVNNLINERLGKSILELGGNNSMIVDESANINEAVETIFFSAIGTAGQRCTTLRRLFIHQNIYDEVLRKLRSKYHNLKIGNPFDEENHIGPLISKEMVEHYKKVTLELNNNRYINWVITPELIDETKNLVKPCVTERDLSFDFIHSMDHEDFLPILHISKFNNIDCAIELNNNSKYGLSSSLFSTNMKNIMKWVSSNGSDCGLANVNVGTSGAEIGMPFGGNKHTGWGRESGGDSWKNYCTRTSSVIRYSDNLELAQGLKFKV